MARPIRGLELDSDQREELEWLVRAPTTPQRSAQRARILLACADGHSQQEAARRVGVRRRIVTKWCGRFRKLGLAGLADAEGRGRKPSVSEERRALILTQATRPPKGQTRHSVRSMARMAQVSVGTVHALWRANDIKPHLTRTFKLSNDPQFEAKFWDVIGLYLNPPDKALVLCCDEKSQCQALERTQPGLPLGVGHIKTRTHDYIRHGTVTLFAALSYLDGKILSCTAEQHTHQEWLAFLKLIERQTPAGLAIHLIIDNYGTHKHPTVKAWLAQHPRFHLHFTPTSSSWLNLVERFFRDLTQDVVREGSFGSVRELVQAIQTYLAERNLAPKRYVWRKKGEEILAKIAKARAAQTAPPPL
ncbi:MAG: IS630 family transposase [Verrucomicrobiota bacterium]